MDEMKGNSGWNTQGGASKLYTCHKFDCDYTTFNKLPKCPKCGSALLDPQTVRLLGVVLTIIGGILSLTGLALLFFVAPNMPRQGSKHLIVYALFFALFAVGCAFFAAGFRQAVTRGKSFTLIAIAVVFVFALALVGALVKIIF